MEKKKPKISRVKELIDATYKQRREWIEYNTPSVSEVFEEYPSLKHGKVVSVIFLFGFIVCICVCMCMCVCVRTCRMCIFLLGGAPQSTLVYMSHLGG